MSRFNGRLKRLETALENTPVHIPRAVVAKRIVELLDRHMNGQLNGREAKTAVRVIEILEAAKERRKEGTNGKLN
jgi:hypothetical protein